MQNEVPFMKCPARGELLEKLVEQHPDLDIRTIHILGQIQSIGRSISSMLDKDLECYGLTEGKFFVLLFLHSEALSGRHIASPSDIASSLEVTRGTITGLLDGLERDGYVVRRHDVNDRRALNIQLTGKGRQFMEDFLPERAISISRALHLESDEACHLIELLLRFESAVTAVRQTIER